MDAFVYFLSILAIGVSGFVFGRLQREQRYRAEAAANLARSLANSNSRRHARAHANRYVLAHGDDDADTGPDSDSDADSDTDGHEARRRAIYRDNGGYRSYPRAARGPRRSTDEAPVNIAALG